MISKANKGAVYQTPEDKVIVKQAKNKKRDKRRERVADEDEFESLFKKYKTNLMKKLDDDVEEAASNKRSGKKVEALPEFEEIEMSDWVKLPLFLSLLN